jgi:hypothetical protein
VLWQLRAVNDEIRFELVPDETQNVTHLTTVKFNYQTSWHVVSTSTVFMWILIYFRAVLVSGRIILKQMLHRFIWMSLFQMQK